MRYTINKPRMHFEEENIRLTEYSRTKYTEYAEKEVLVTAIKSMALYSNMTRYRKAVVTWRNSTEKNDENCVTKDMIQD